MKQRRQARSTYDRTLPRGTAPARSIKPAYHPRHEPEMDRDTYLDQLDRKYRWNNSRPEWALACGIEETCESPDGTQRMDGRIGVEPLPTDEVIGEEALGPVRPRQPLPGEEKEPLPTHEVIGEDELLSSDDSPVPGRTIGEEELNSP